MSRSETGGIKRGQAISFRVPSDTPDHILKHLQKLKETERRNFSSKIAEFVMEGVGSSYKRERETVTIPLPHKLTKSQRDWLKHEHSEALLGSIVHHLLTDPIRSTALLASLNSKAVEIDDALYLQEDLPGEGMDLQEADDPVEVTVLPAAQSLEDDLDSLDWESAKQSMAGEGPEEEKEEDLDSLLGDFLASMNK